MIKNTCGETSKEHVTVDLEKMKRYKSLLGESVRVKIFHYN